MPTYVSPERFRVAGTGIDLSSIEDVELASVLARASSTVNAYCAVPKLPQEHDFRGGTITGERHRWHLGTGMVPVSRRYLPWHGPVREVTQFRIHVTEGSYIEIDPADLFINNSEGYIEVVALTLGIGVFPVVANLTMNQPVAETDYTYRYEFGVVGEVLAETDGETFRSQYQFWADDPAPVIYVNGAEETTGFTIDGNEGTITFTTALTATDVVSADYTYTLPSQIADATIIIAADSLAERSLATKGMVGLLELQVAEVRLRRPTPTALLTRETPSIPRAAITLLEPFVFRSVG